MVSGSARSPARNSVRNFDRSYCANSLPSRVFLLDGAERGRRGEHRDALVLGDDAPERAGVGRADRLALVEDRGAAVQQRRIDDVAVADHPADVGGRPPDLAGLDAVEILHRPFAARPCGRRCRAPRPSGCRSCPRCRGCRADRWRHRHAGSARSCAADQRLVPGRLPVVVAAGDQLALRTAGAAGSGRPRGLCLASSIASSSSGL